MPRSIILQAATVANPRVSPMIEAKNEKNILRMKIDGVEAITEAFIVNDKNEC